MQVLYLLAVFLIFAFGFIKLLGNQAHLLSLCLVYAFQPCSFGLHGFHAVGLVAEGAGGRRHVGIQHGQLPPDVRKRLLVFLVAQDAYFGADAIIVHDLTPFFEHTKSTSPLSGRVPCRCCDLGYAQIMSSVARTSRTLSRMWQITRSMSSPPPQYAAPLASTSSVEVRLASFWSAVQGQWRGSCCALLSLSIQCEH